MSSDSGILGIGHAILDLEFKVTQESIKQLGMVPDDTTLIDWERSQQMLQVLGQPRLAASGGSVANSLVCAASKMPTTMLCRLGEDDYGTIYREQMEKIGISMPLRQPATQPTGTCLVLLSDQTRTMGTSLGASAGITMKDIDAICQEHSLFQRHTWLLIEGYTLASEMKEAISNLAKLAKNSGMKIALTLSSAALLRMAKDEFVDMIKMGVDLVGGNWEEGGGTGAKPRRS